MRTSAVNQIEKSRVTCTSSVNRIGESMVLCTSSRNWIRKSKVMCNSSNLDSPTLPSDFRPISIVPVLSRLVEQDLVHTNMYSSFQAQPMSIHLADQYAFRPTVSTNTALISILQQTSSVLKENTQLCHPNLARLFLNLRHRPTRRFSAQAVSP